jgi:hypothetical protein
MNDGSVLKFSLLLQRQIVCSTAVYSGMVFIILLIGLMLQALVPPEVLARNPYKYSELGRRPLCSIQQID